MKQVLVAEIKEKIRRQIVRLIQVEQNAFSNNNMLPLAQSSWNDGMHNIIKSMASALQQSLSWT
jgi:hypothetical protein